MQERRDFIKTLASALVLPLTPATGFAAELPATPAATPAARAGDFVAGGFFIVNGWVLTRADLAALNLDDL
jgi:predicted cobalt transporter CbtA